MFKTIYRLIVALLLVVGWTLAGLSLHVVRTPGEMPITLITKDSFGIKDTYVDTRTWTLDDAAQHPALVQKIVRTGKADLLKHVVPAGGDVSAQLIDAVQRAPQPPHTQPSRTTQPATASMQNAASIFHRY